MLKIQDLRDMRGNPMMDPRDWTKKTEDYWYHPARIAPLRRAAATENVRQGDDSHIARFGAHPDQALRHAQISRLSRMG